MKPPRSSGSDGMDIRISFYGAARNVTGSRFLVQANGYKVLVDCGLYQERQFRSRNFDPFPVAADSIDAVCLTHAHLDHCGLLPKLVRDGFAGPIHCTAATAEIAKIVVLDSAHIQEEDAAFKKRRHQAEGRVGPHPYEPLYTTADAQACAAHFAPGQYERPVPVADGIEATFHNAGHILGASIIRLRISRNGRERTILFTGDLGRPDMPIVRDAATFKQADYVLIESTYGDRVHEQTADIADSLAEVVNATVKAGGNLVIPSFALERSQDLVYYLNELMLADRIPGLMVFLDSPMAINVTRVFEDHPELYDEDMARLVRRRRGPFDLPGLHMTPSVEQSKRINHIRGSAIIIAGSGMCTGGRIKHHLVNNIARPECTILFVGYQAAGTLGRIILDGAEEVRILGQTYPVRAKIARLRGFSAHADRDELMGWLGSLERPPRRVFVVHGEADSAMAFGQHVREKTGWNVSVPKYEETVELD